MNNSGYLYYIKLNTKMGIFYKVGYTTMDSIEKRFTYNNSIDYNLIDEVLLFEHDYNAHSREQKIHRKYRRKKAFSKYSNKTYFPLAKNGQSELYYEDILEKDSNYSKEKAELTKLNIKAMEINKNILGYIVMFIAFIVLFPISLGVILLVLFFTEPIDKSIPLSKAYNLKFKQAYNNLLELKDFFKIVWHLIKNYKSIQNMYL